MIFAEYCETKAKIYENRVKTFFSLKTETNNSNFIKTGGLSNEENDY